MIFAGITVGRGRIVLALKPAALQPGLVVPDVDRAHQAGHWTGLDPRHRLDVKILFFRPRLASFTEAAEE